MAVIAIPKPLRDRLGDEGTDALVQIVREIDSGARIDTLGVVEERFERRLSEENAKSNNCISEEVARLDKRITEESVKLDKRISEEVAKLDKRISDEVARLDRRITEESARLHIEIAKSRTEIIKWMFIFWCGQIGVIIALFKLFSK